MATDTTSVDSLSTASNPVRLARQLDGMLGVTPLMHTGQGFQRLARQWASISSDECANGLFEAPPRIFNAPLPAIAAYAYDAVAALMLALTAAVSAGNTTLPTGAAMRAELFGMSFEGARLVTDANTD